MASPPVQDSRIRPSPSGKGFAKWRLQVWNESAIFAAMLKKWMLWSPARNPDGLWSGDDPRGPLPQFRKKADNLYPAQRDNEK
jgi:hypothetical protein